MKSSTQKSQFAKKNITSIKDLELSFSGLSKIKPIFLHIPGPGVLMQKFPWLLGGIERNHDKQEHNILVQTMLLPLHLFRMPPGKRQPMLAVNSNKSTSRHLLPFCQKWML
jgi:hypothetical protein